MTIPANVLPLLRAAVDKWPQTRPLLSGKSRKVVGAAPFTVPYSRFAWDSVREAAGIMELDKRTKRGGRRKHKASVWQGSILRHTGISYLNQLLTAKAQRGEFNEKSVIAEVCRQAGNTTDAAFRFYLALPKEGDADRFYAAPRAAT